MSRGFYTVFPKAPSTRFVVKNIAPNGKRIRIFNYPIVNGGTRDLLSIPEISEATIRHSLLKGELITKARCGEITVLDSDIDLTQYNADHRAFLVSIGITNGLDGPGGGGGSTNFFLHENMELIGTQDGSNRVFTTPEPFLNGVFDNHEFSIRIRFNGQTLVENLNYTLSESGGSGTGFNTITFIGFAPEAKHEIRVDYATDS